MERRYKDLDLRMTKHPMSGDINRKFDAEAIKQSIRHLIYTRELDWGFMPELACGVHRMLFEPMTPATTFSIQKSIEEVINNYEPRVELQDVRVVARPDYNHYDISIVFMIVNRNEPYTLNTTLKRLR